MTNITPPGYDEALDMIKAENRIRNFVTYHFIMEARERFLTLPFREKCHRKAIGYVPA